MKRIKLHFAAGLALCACLLMCLSLAWAPLRARAEGGGVPGVVSARTSTGYRYGEEVYAKTYNQFPDIMALLASRGTVPIPGLELTCLVNDSCSKMVPQGLCVTADYILVTAYCSCQTPKHPSTVYVIDRSTGDFLCCLSLPFSSHVGGIAYDEDHDNIWISNGHTVCQLTPAMIANAMDNASRNGRDVAEITPEKTLYLTEQASFLSCFDNSLWVGYCSNNGNGKLFRYKFTNSNGDRISVPTSSYAIPNYGNGCALAEVNDKVCLLLNTSYARNDSYKNYTSCMHFYVVNEEENKLDYYGHRPMPPMAEEIEIRDGLIYTIFESAATKYSDKSNSKRAEYILDRILIGNAEDFFSYADPAGIIPADTEPVTTGAQRSSSESRAPLDMSEGFTEVRCFFNNRFSGSQLESYLPWSDRLLVEANGSEPDPEIAKVSVQLAAAAYQKGYIIGALRNMGFSKINSYNFNRDATYADNDFVAFTIAQKRVEIENTNYSLYVVAIRGTTESAEWYSNFNLGTGDDHRGFHLAAAEVSEALERDFLSRDAIDASHRRILVTGHSRGAAVANIIAARLSGASGRVFGYTFACPRVSRNVNKSLGNVFNFNFSGDPIATMPCKAWGFERNGRDIDLTNGSYAYENMTEQFGRQYGTAFSGSPQFGNNFSGALSSLVANQTDYNHPLVQNMLDVVAFTLGGKNAKVSPDSIIALFINKVTRPAAHMWSLFKTTTNWPLFMEEVETCKNIYSQLIQDTDAATESVNDDFSEWSKDNSTLLSDLKEYADIQISNFGDVLEARRGLQVDLDDLVRLTTGTGNLVSLFLDTDGKPIVALTHGHCEEQYIAFINSLYFGSWGWTESQETAVDIPSGTRTIGRNCFYNASLGETSLPEGLEFIGDYAFYNCPALKTALPDTLISLGDHCFQGCASLETLEIPNTMTRVGYYAFKECTGLREVTMPVEMTPYTLFDDCCNVESIHYTVSGDGVMPDRARDYTGSYYNDPIPRIGLEYYSADSLRDVVFDEGTTHISEYLFNYRNTALEHVTLPESVQTIGNDAFGGLKVSIDGPENGLPSALVELGEGCLSGTLLGEITIPAAITVIPDRCFLSCELLTCDLPETVVSLGDFCFCCCAFESVEIRNTVTHVGQNAFGGCEALKTATVPVELPFNELFGSCSGLESIHFTVAGDGVMPKDNNALEYYVQNSLKHVVFDEGVKYIAPFLVGTAEGAELVVTLPESVEEIGKYAFYHVGTINGPANGLPASLKTLGENCFAFSGLGEVKIPAGVTALPDRCFYACQSLELELPETVLTLGKECFYGCTSLKSILLKSVTIVWDNCFSGCTGLESLEISSTATLVRPGAFTNCTGLREVTMPVELYHFYAFVGCDGVESIHYTVSGDGMMRGRKYPAEETLEWCSHDSLKHVTFDEGTTCIGDYAFCDNTGLETVVLPETVRSIGSHAFEGVKATFTGTADFLPNALYGTGSLGEYCFADTALEEITFLDRLYVLPDGCFANCANLSMITFEGDPPTISDSAFTGVHAIAIYPGDNYLWQLGAIQDYGGELTWIDARTITMVDGQLWAGPTYEWAEDNSSVTARRICLTVEGLEETETAPVEIHVEVRPEEYSNGVTAYSARFTNPVFGIQSKTEYDIPPLYSMNLLRLPAGLTTIGEEAFSGLACQGVIVPPEVTAIESRAFAGCANLIYVRLPAGLTDIAPDAFEGCDSVRLDYCD